MQACANAKAFGGGDNEVIPFEVGRVGQVIRNVNDFFGRNRPHGSGFCTGHYWHNSVCYAAVTCGTAHCAIFIKEQGCSICVANPYSLVQYDIENALQLSRRTRDDLEHLRSCRLLLQRFAQLGKQARVFDGDDGLGSEGRHQRDLFVGKWANFLTKDCKRTDKFALLQHWDSKVRPYTPKLYGSNVCRMPFSVGRLC